MVAIITLLASITLAWTLYNVVCLLRNYILAVKIGLPCIISPITPDNPLWIALQVTCGRIVRQLPFDALSFTKYTRLGWEYGDRYATAVRMGEAWVLVTPARNWVFIVNPQTVTNIFQRSREFIHPAWMVESLTVFGPSISVAEGQDWQRQRKLTATPFNESRNPLVWDEAVRQTKQMIRHWQSMESTGFNSTTDDARSVALNVLAFAAFQKSYPFRTANRQTSKAEPDSPMTYRDAIGTIVSNLLIILVVPRSFYSLPLLPYSWRRVGQAISYFRQYMLHEIREEQDLIAAGQPGTGTLVSNLVRAGQDKAIKVEQPLQMAVGGVGSLKPLSEAEILGNIFVFNFAGHDTTALSLGYALLLMVANPDVQDWVHEEISYYTTTQYNKQDTLDYVTLFPKLKRCLSVLLETLRLYNPLPGVPKYTGHHSATISINGTSHILPPDTLVCPHLATCHTHPRHWSDDSLTWRPQRWIVEPSQSRSGTTRGRLGTVDSTTQHQSDIEQETLFTPEKGVYFAWSEGLRNCPGKKFAQVEFVAVMVTLFRNMVGEPVLKPGEDMKQGCQRILDVVKDSSVQLLLQMNNPKAATVRWRERKQEMRSPRT